MMKKDLRPGKVSKGGVNKKPTDPRPAGHPIGIKLVKKVKK